MPVANPNTYRNELWMWPDRKAPVKLSEIVMHRTVWGGQVPSCWLGCSESSARVQTQSFWRHLTVPTSASKSSFLHTRAYLAFIWLSSFLGPPNLVRKIFWDTSSHSLLSILAKCQFLPLWKPGSNDIICARGRRRWDGQGCEDELFSGGSRRMCNKGVAMT